MSQCCEVLILPRGGEIGPPGPPGEQGIQGIQGIQGVKGNDGIVNVNQGRKLVKEFIKGGVFSSLHTITITSTQIINAGISQQAGQAYKVRVYYRTSGNNIWRDLQVVFPQFLTIVWSFGDLIITVIDFSGGDVFRVVVYG